MAIDYTTARSLLERFHQKHLLDQWDHLNETSRHRLLAQIESIDFALVESLHQQQDQTFSLPDINRVEPAPVLGADAGIEARSTGEELLRQGRVAVLLVAGGQGSRLGFEHPKGMFPLGPVTERSLFQIHAEKVLALERRYQAAIPFLIMTSPATDEETQQFFHEHGWFGLDPGRVHFFCQGTMPAVDLTSGKILLDGPDQVFLSPDGHGGMLAALAKSGLMEKLRENGQQHLYYFQVDNPLTRIADPEFLGLHARHKSEVSTKIVPKEDPRDKLGNLVLIDGRCSIIEYSDLPEEWGKRRTPDGKLWIWAGSPAIHIFAIEFLERMSSSGIRIPFHIARKKVPYLNAASQRIEPEKENALKFERFIFDLLPLADRSILVETSRAQEFMPVKNASGPDSPATARQAVSNLGASWLEKAGVNVPRRGNGDVSVNVEISPLFALDEAEMVRRLPPGWKPEVADILLRGS